MALYIDIFRQCFVYNSVNIDCVNCPKSGGNFYQQAIHRLLSTRFPLPIPVLNSAANTLRSHIFECLRKYTTQSLDNLGRSPITDP